MYAHVRTRTSPAWGKFRLFFSGNWRLVAGARLRGRRVRLRVTPRQQSTYTQHPSSAQHRAGVVQPVRALYRAQEHVVADHGLTTHPADQARAESNNDGKALHEPDHQRAAKNHQRNADGQAQDEQRGAALGGSGRGNDLIRMFRTVDLQQRFEQLGHL